jgi:hypothetical protein
MAEMAKIVRARRMKTAITTPNEMATLLAMFEICDPCCHQHT